MLRIKKFSANEDAYVLVDFSTYKKGDIIPAGKLDKIKAVSLWLEGKIQNVGTKAYTKEQLENFSFKELKEIAEPYGITDRSKTKLIKEILAAI